jgi:hypothetical protein
MTLQATQEPKHTSGPWGISLNSKTGAKIISFKEGEIIAKVNKLTDSRKLEYDARLISAAPVMLEALQAVADSMIGSDSFIARQVRVAIVKATQ